MIPRRFFLSSPFPAFPSSWIFLSYRELEFCLSREEVRELELISFGVCGAKRGSSGTHNAERGLSQFFWVVIFHYWGF